MEVMVREGIVGSAPTHSTGIGLERWALVVLQLGALAVVLVAATDRDFDLDRFFVPKEFALHLTALIAGLLAVRTFRRIAFTWVDALLGAYLLLALVSSILAQDRELAARALAISVSGVAIFWAARAISEAGLARPLLRALALAAVLGAVMSLLQTYGVQTDFFSVNRAPGGTLGNRNFVAHMAAYGLPIVMLAALRAWRPAGYLIGALGVTLVVASLVLTRSRAGWLAFGVAMLVFVLGMVLSRPLRRDGRSWKRLAGIAALVGGGVAAAILLPNSLRWASENPYLESITGIVNYQEGSGAGRLVQYRQSLEMAIDQPLLGVGPGNWSEAYPEYAVRNDPSLSRSEPGTTANPWPSSDWVASVAERGFPATILLAVAMLGIGLAALRRVLRARDHEEGLLSLTLLATAVASVIAGLFDAVLLLAPPTLLVWAALGALSSPTPAPESPTRARVAGVLLVVLALAAGVGAALSLRELLVMSPFELQL